MSGTSELDVIYNISKIPKNTSGLYIGCVYSGHGVGRSVSCNDTSVTFGDGYLAVNVHNGRAIPRKIYGYK